MDPTVSFPIATIWAGVFGLVIALLGGLSLYVLRSIVGRIDVAVAELKLVDGKIAAYIATTEARLARMEEWMRSHERYEHPPHSHVGKEPPFP